MHTAFLLIEFFYSGMTMKLSGEKNKWTLQLTPHEGETVWIVQTTYRKKIVFATELALIK